MSSSDIGEVDVLVVNMSSDDEPQPGGSTVEYIVDKGSKDSSMFSSTVRHSDTENSEEESSSSDIEEISMKTASKMNKILENMSSDDSDDTDDGDSDIELQPGGSTVQYVIDKGDGEEEHLGNVDIDDDINNGDQKLNQTKGRKNVKNNAKKVGYQLSSALKPDIDPKEITYLNTDIYSKPVINYKNITDLMLNPSNETPLLKKSVLTSDFEKKSSISEYQQSVRQMKRDRKKERSATKGKKWFDFAAPEVTEKERNDLTVLKMRDVLDPTHFYKRQKDKLPKYFQMGKVVDSPLDFYNSRVPKKERKQTLVDELLADSEFRKYNKRKYTEIQQKKEKYGRANKHMKRLKKHKK